MLIDYYDMLLPMCSVGHAGRGKGPDFMIALFAKTWFLWWLLAGVVVLRWFHGVRAIDPEPAHRFVYDVQSGKLIEVEGAQAVGKAA